MGSVIESYRLFGGKKFKLYLGIFLVYFIAGFAFLAVGLQPIKSAEAAYAAESETAEESLTIPAINLSAPVKITSLNGNDLIVPEQIAASFSMSENKTLIIGHSSTIFTDLKDVKMNDEIIYQGETYRVTSIEEKLKNAIDMSEILKSENSPTIILMTCSGDRIEGTAGDHTHRLIITAEQPHD